MHTVTRAALMLALAAALFSAAIEPPAQAQSEPQAAARRAPLPQRGALLPLAPAPGEVIVRFKADAPTVRQHALTGAAKPEAVGAVLSKRAATLGARIGRALEAGPAVGERMQVVREPGADAVALARRIAADPEVEFAEPNGRQRRLQVPPNDPLYGFAARPPNGPDAGQWYLRAPNALFRSSINAEAAWLARGFGSPTVVVAVLDTGVRFEHPDLGRVATGGRLLPGYDFVSSVTVANDGDGRDGDPSDPGDWTSTADLSSSEFSGCEVSDSSWHGTATASLVGAAANNGIGIAGSAPGVQVQPVRVLGKCFGRDSDIQAAMRWAAGIAVDGVPANANPAKVINMSLGSDAVCSAGYQAVVSEIVARGVVIVAAAGNSTGGPVGTPASCAGVVAVGGLRHAGTKVGFSDLGAEVAIAAPAGNCINIDGGPCLYPIVAAIDDGLTSPVAPAWSDSVLYPTLGTSFASPLVAGVVALMFSQNAALTVEQVRALLQGTARAFPAATGGAGEPPACTVPARNVQQLECYCPNPTGPHYPLCGAGMLDANAAVRAAAAGLVALVDVQPAVAEKGQLITLSSQRSAAAAGRSIVSRSWTLINGGGAVGGFTSPTNGATATLSPAATGTIVVQLTLTDDAGASISQIASIVVAEPAPVDGGDGGGALSWPWLLLLGLAVVALARTRGEGGRGPGGGHRG
jgi:serine protease